MAFTRTRTSTIEWREMTNGTVMSMMIGGVMDMMMDTMMDTMRKAMMRERRWIGTTSSSIDESATRRA